MKRRSRAAKGTLLRETYFHQDNPGKRIQSVALGVQIVCEWDPGSWRESIGKIGTSGDEQKNDIVEHDA